MLSFSHNPDYVGVMSQVTFDFRESSVVITGGAGGIGAGIGALFAGAGARVAVWDRDPGAFPGGWEPAALLAADVTDEASLREAFAQTLDHLGSVDIVVSSAGSPARSDRCGSTTRLTGGAWSTST